MLLFFLQQPPHVGLLPKVCEAHIDGGYGWLVVAAAFLAHFFQYGVVWSVGVFYVLFLENVGGQQGAVALISSLNTATFYVTGELGVGWGSGAGVAAGGCGWGWGW